MTILAFLLPLLFVSSADGFSRRWAHVPRAGDAMKPLGLASDPWSASNANSGITTNKLAERRDVLASGLLLTFAALGGAALSSRNPVVDSASSSPTRIASVDEALTLIESACDRRFLHGVVASGYRLMYRGIPIEESRIPSVWKGPSDLLLPSTYGSKEAADFFASLEVAMKDQPIRPSNGHLATTSVDSAEAWGEAASIWPLGDNVHFAWLEEGGDFWFSEETKLRDASQLKVIVDGVDCGRMALEDALLGENSEIMFRADRYLAVPISLEKELLSRLKSSFII